MQEIIKVIEMPIEVEIDNSEAIRRDTELKYRNYIAEIKEKYETEINQLHLNIRDLQAILIETNQEKELIRDSIERIRCAE